MPDWVPGLVLPLRRGWEVGGEVPGTSLQRPLQWSRTGRAQLPQQRAQAARAQSCPAGTHQRVSAQGFYWGAGPTSTLCPTPTLTPDSQEDSRRPVLALLSVHREPLATPGGGGSGVGGTLPRSELPDASRGPTLEAVLPGDPHLSLCVNTLTLPRVPPLLPWPPHYTSFQGIDI